MRGVVEALELAERAVLVVEEHAGVRGGGVAEVLHGEAGGAAVGVGEEHVEEVEGVGGAEADGAGGLVEGGVADIGAVDVLGEVVGGAGRTASGAATAACGLAASPPERVPVVPAASGTSR